MKVEVQHLCRSFGPLRAVDDLSFEFSSHSVCGFIGSNGAGKSTALRMMATVMMPDSGDVLYDGVSGVDYPEEVRRVMGFMPDSLPDFSDTTVEEYLDFCARSFLLKGEGRKRALERVTEMTGIGDFRQKFLNTLSKGMKQRVTLARALVHDPEVLIMDEPAAGLDPMARMEIRKILKNLAEEGKALILSSHILSDLQEICDQAVIIEKGKLLFSGPVAGKNIEELFMKVSTGAVP